MSGSYRKIKLNYKSYVKQTKSGGKYLQKWLHNALVTLNFLNANKKGTKVAERHLIIENSSELNQPVYFKDVSISLWRSGDVVHWQIDFPLVSTGEKYVMDTIKINKDSVWKREISWEREMTAHPQWWKSYRLKENLIRVGAGFYFCLCRKILIFKKSRDPGHLDA